MIRLTRAQVRRIDELALKDYGIPGIVLMENAARAAADVALQMLDGENRRVLIFCGGGNNGGDGLAIARHLHNADCEVTIFKAFDEAKLPNDAAINWRIVQAMKLPVIDALHKVGSKPDLILDALLGTGLTAAPRANIVELIRWINASGRPVLAVDIPSGLDCDAGQPIGDDCVRATKTVTFVAKKIGFAQAVSKPFIGEVIVGSIGCPRELVEKCKSTNL